MTKPTIKTVFWDLDGTLINSEHLHEDAAFNAFKQLDIPLISHEVTPGIENKQAFVELTGLNLSEPENNALFQQWDNLAVELVSQQISCNDAIHQSVNLFKLFHSRNIVQSVVSNSYLRLVQHSLHQLGIDKLVHQVYARDLVKYGKPNPELYQKALQGQSNPLHNCLAFEDSNTGISAAQAINLNVVAIGKNHRSNILELDLQQNDWLNLLNEHYQF